MNTETQRIGQHIIKRLCPFIKNHYDICYFTKLGSNDMEKAVYYCIKYYETCDIYREKKGISFNKFFSENGGNGDNGNKNK